MSGSAQRALRPRRRPPSVVTLRQRLDDGAATTLYVAAFPLAAVDVRVARLDGSESLARWCRRAGVAHAIVGGFFVRPAQHAAGRAADRGRRRSRPSRSPRRGTACARACRSGRTGSRSRAAPSFRPSRAGDLLQAGPLLVRDGASVVTGGDDEGFTAGAHQFDSDISDGRHPRCALALTADHAARGRLRRPPRRRRRADAGRAGATRSSGSARAARSTSTAAARRRSSATAGSSTGRASSTASSCSTAAPIATALVSRSALPERCHTRRPVARACSGTLFFPRGGSAFVTRALARGLAERGLRRHARSPARATTSAASATRGASTPASTCTRSTSPRALRAPRPDARSRARRAARRCSRRSRTGRAPADRVFASLDDAAYERQVAAWARELRAAGAARGRRAAPAPPDAAQRRGGARSRPACRSSATCTAPSC